MIKSMKELDSIESNGYSMVSSFSGCGGSCLGFKANGFDIKAAIEFIPEAVRTYKANFKNTYVYETDIRDIQGKDILNKIGILRGDLDVFEGSPPCSDFSKQRLSSGADRGKFKKYSSTKQRVDDLFYEYARLLKELCPKIFVAENVENLIHQEDYLYGFIDALENSNEIGYNVYYRVIDFSMLGVPQMRKRLIFIGVRKDLDIEAIFPEENESVVTTRQAIGDLVDSGSDLKMSELEQKYCKLIPTGAGVEYLTMLRDKYNLKIYISNHRRDLWESPHTTLVQNTRPIHQLKNRWLNVKEAKRLSTFPDDFILTGTSAQQWERIGRAVPPKASYEIAKCIKRMLDEVYSN